MSAVRFSRLGGDGSLQESSPPRKNAQSDGSKWESEDTATSNLEHVDEDDSIESTSRIESVPRIEFAPRIELPNGTSIT
jgi:hypothetical protein